MTKTNITDSMLEFRQMVFNEDIMGDDAYKKVQNLASFPSNLTSYVSCYYRKATSMLRIFLMSG